MNNRVLMLCLLFACNDDPAFAQVDNGYATVDGVVVYKAWWSSTLFSNPVSPSTSSEQQRTVTNTDYAYALITRGWDPTSTTPPASLVVVRSASALTVARGDTLQIVVSPETFRGDCGRASVLTQEETDFVTSRIFPGDFAGFRYDASTCTLTATPADAAGEAGAD